MESFNNTVISSISRARMGSTISTYFGTQKRNLHVNQEHHNNSIAEILPAKLGNNNNSFKMNRKRSRYENHPTNSRKRSRNSRVSNSLESNESNFITSNVKTRSCGICKKKGHFRGECPNITNWKKLPTNDPTERISLQAQICSPPYIIIEELGDNNLPMSKTLPSNGMKGIVLHKLVRKKNSRNHLIECTILDKCGAPHNIFKNYLFEPNMISKWIGGGGPVARIVISMLQVDTTSQHMSLSFSQQAQNSGIVEHPVIKNSQQVFCSLAKNYVGLIHQNLLQLQQPTLSEQQQVSQEPFHQLQEQNVQLQQHKNDLVQDQHARSSAINNVPNNDL